MVAQAFRDVEARHHLLDGFLARLARCRDVDAYALRGGMLVRHWFPDVGRPAADIDLVCSLPYDLGDLRSRLHEVLAVELADGVVFDRDRFRTDQLRPQSSHPGLRLFVAGTFAGWAGQMSVDLTFHLDAWPAACRTSIATSLGEVQLWTCRPEMLTGRKLQVTAELGHRYWRPKDVADLLLMCRHFPSSASVLGEAVERSFVGQPDRQLAQLPRLFGSRSFLRDDRARGRWRQYVHRTGISVPAHLDQVVTELHTHLRPILRTP